MGSGCVALSLLLLGSPAGAQEETPDEIDAALSAQPGTEAVDAATLLDLDELLGDPVRLQADDVQRLLWIPWVTPLQVESLRAGLPVDTPAAWSALPHWSAQDVQRLLPFVVFETTRPSTGSPAGLPFDARANVYALKSGRRSSARLTTGSLHLAAQGHTSNLGEGSGFIRWDGSRLEWMIGDLRRTIGLGMMGASRVQSSQAGASVVPTDSWSGTTSLWRDHVLRGAAARLHVRRASVELLRGESLPGKVQGVGLSVRLPRHWQAQVFGMRLHRQVWLSALLQHQSAHHQVAVEFVRQPQHVSSALWWRFEHPTGRLETALLVAPHGVSSPLSSAPSSARDVGWWQFRMRAWWFAGPLTVRGGWLQSQWSGATLQRRDRLSLQAVARAGRGRLEAQWRSSQTEEQSVGFEALEDRQRQQEQHLLLRLAFPLGNARLSVERRSHARQVSDGAARGIGWRLGSEHRLGGSAVDLSAIFVEEADGVSMVFSEPGVGSAPALFYARSGSMRFSARLRHPWRHVRASLRVGIGWDPEHAWLSVVEAALRFRLPGANGF